MGYSQTSSSRRISAQVLLTIMRDLKGVELDKYGSGLAGIYDSFNHILKIDDCIIYDEFYILSEEEVNATANPLDASEAMEFTW